MLTAAAHLLVLAAAVDARFLVSMAGVPSASLEVSVDEGGAYRYRAVHVLEEGEGRLERSWTLSDGGVDGLVPEVLALLAPPALGCRQVLEERRGLPEALCVTRAEARRVEGTLDGVAFTAWYRAGSLDRVAVGPVRFERVAGAPRLRAVTSPFVEGFRVRGTTGPARLEPPLPGAARVVRVTLRPGALAASASRRRCLEVARRAVEADPSLTLVLGLVLEGGRAFPHAWVRRGDRHQDPTLGAEDGPLLGRREYLELAPDLAGRVYLELLDGRRLVARGE
jgi:hypothetical protein